MPKQIGRYKIIEQIGKGAMAIVYKAHDPRIDRTLAIKVLRKERCIDKEYRKRFIKESRAAGNLSHPNIVTVFDVGEHNDQPYIAMELLPGIPLDVLLKSDIRLNHEQIHTISVQLAEGLDYAHNSGIVHRDIKPSNIVCQLTETGGLHLKITDFGIAHIENSDMTQQTQDGDVLGTPLYMSPEQVHGKKIDGRSDLFSLGVILYQLYTGRKPFKGSTIATVLHKISTENPLPINKLVNNLPRQTENIIHRLLNKNPDLRFQSGYELVMALNNSYLEQNRDCISTGSFLPMYRGKPLLTNHQNRLTLPIMVFIFTLAFLCIACVLLLHTQQKLLIDNLNLTGKSITAIIAGEFSEALLAEDWVAIDLFTRDMTKRNDIAFLTISDRYGNIHGENKLQQLHITKDQEHEFSFLFKQAIYTYTAPVYYQNKSVGEINLGLNTQHFRKTMLSTALYMLLVSLTFSCILAYLTYIFTNRKTRISPTYSPHNKTTSQTNTAGIQQNRLEMTDTKHKADPAEEETISEEQSLTAADFINEETYLK